MTETDPVAAAPLNQWNGDAHAAQRWHYTLTLAALLVGGVLAVVVPAALVGSVQDVGASRAWLLTLGVMSWSGARLAVAIVLGKRHLFDFFFWVFAYLFMGLAPTVQIRSGLIATTTPGINASQDMTTAILVWIGMLAYEAGRLVVVLVERRRNAGPRALRSEPRVRPRVPRTIAVPAAFALSFVALLASAYYVMKMGPSSLLVDRYTAESIRAQAFPDSSTRSMAYALAIYPMLIAIGALIGARHRARPLVSKLMVALAIVECGLLLAVVNPISSARYTLGTVLFALAVYLGAVASAFRTRLTMIATIGGFIFVFPLADAFRVSTAATVSRDGFFGEYKGNADYDAFWQVANAWTYQHDGLVVFGRQLLGSLFFWVPRAVWADKPTDTGILLAQFRGYNFTNLSSPLWAEFLVNGGLLFLIGGFLIVGAGLRILDRKIATPSANAGPWLVASAVFPVYMTILLRGSLLQATGSILVALVCLLLVSSARGTTSPEATPQSSDSPEATAHTP
jgi:hypothetical protein